MIASYASRVVGQSAVILAPLDFAQMLWHASFIAKSLWSLLRVVHQRRWNEHSETDEKSCCLGDTSMWWQQCPQILVNHCPFCCPRVVHYVGQCPSLIDCTELKGYHELSSLISTQGGWEGFKSSIDYHFNPTQKPDLKGHTPSHQGRHRSRDPFTLSPSRHSLFIINQMRMAQVLSSECLGAGRIHRRLDCFWQLKLNAILEVLICCMPCNGRLTALLSCPLEAR